MTKNNEKKSLTKADMIAYIAEGTELSRKQVEQVFAKWFDKIIAELQDGREVSWWGSKYVPVKKAATPGGKRRNPFTGEMAEYPSKPAYRTVRVKVLKKLKDAVNNES